MDNNFFGKRVLIVGSGISGKGAALALKQCGALIYFFDGTYPEGVDIIVMSPGIKDDKFTQYAKQKNIPVIGEIELGFKLDIAPIVAITGTNGKTTTTMLTGDILKLSGFETIVCGNIGTSYSSSVLSPHTRSVVEVSSFQLLTVQDFCPHVAIITNITPDHLDRHGSMENYINAKLNICRNQTASDYIITSREVRILLKEFGVRSQIVTLGSDINYDGGVLSVFGKKIAKVDELNQKEEHNVINALFASAAAILEGADINAVHDALVNFKPAEHRLKFVGKYNGKNYFNDSKGTNIGAAIAAAKSMNGTTVLIAGGSDKGYEFDELFIELPKSIKYVIGMGEVKEKLKEAAYRQGFDRFILASGLEDAVETAKTLDVVNVLLSPAAASFDCYDGYDKRGEHFERLIRA
ncbi:MAG: UDP-N-acetylmuramoyl-L-alanine--D-glutamate ligase [Clostridiales bacterium]|nr:UDP-N-acetylmuramoyl-L-alanine--D-glutamate ligase [Clostridiales bacterium]